MACRGAFGADRMDLDDSSFQLEIMRWEVLQSTHSQTVSDFSPYFSAALSELQLGHRAEERDPGNLLSLDRFSGIFIFS